MDYPICNNCNRPIIFSNNISTMDGRLACTCSCKVWNITYTNSTNVSSPLLVEKKFEGAVPQAFTEQPEFLKHIDLRSTAPPLDTRLEIVGDTLRVHVDDHNAKLTTQIAFPLEAVLTAIPLNVLTAHILSRRVL